MGVRRHRCYVVEKDGITARVHCDPTLVNDAEFMRALTGVMKAAYRELQRPKRAPEAARRKR